MLSQHSYNIHKIQNAAGTFTHWPKTPKVFVRECNGLANHSPPADIWTWKYRRTKGIECMPELRMHTGSTYLQQKSIYTWHGNFFVALCFEQWQCWLTWLQGLRNCDIEQLNKTHTCAAIGATLACVNRVFCELIVSSLQIIVHCYAASRDSQTHIQQTYY